MDNFCPSKTSVVLNEDYNVTVISDKLIGITKYVTQ
jgi:hypothetical protein